MLDTGNNLLPPRCDGETEAPGLNSCSKDAEPPLSAIYKNSSLASSFDGGCFHESTAVFEKNFITGHDEIFPYQVLPS